jgi:hypothetical protein
MICYTSRVIDYRTWTLLVTSDEPCCNFTDKECVYSITATTVLRSSSRSWSMVFVLFSGKVVKELLDDEATYFLVVLYFSSEYFKHSDFLRTVVQLVAHFAELCDYAT